MAAPKKSGAKKATKKATKKTTKKAAKKTTKKAAKKSSATKKATPRKAAKKKPTKQAAAKATSRSAKASTGPEPSMRTAAEKAKGAAGDVTVVVASRVKDLMKNLDMRSDSDLVHAVNERVQDMLTKAAERAQDNQRKTVRPHDL